MTIEDFVSIVPHHPRRISRADLRDMASMSDREMRQMVEKARQQGHLICNEQDGTGYYIATERGQVERQIAQMTHRQSALVNQINGMAARYMDQFME